MLNNSTQPVLRGNYSWKAASRAQANAYGLSPSIHPAGRMSDGDVQVEDLWLEIPLDENWIVGYRLSVSPTGPTVFSEVRVFPNEAVRANAGEWSGDFRGTKARPRAPLTAKILRSVRLDEHRRILARILRNVKERGAEATFGNVAVPRLTGGRLGGARGRDAEFYARFALAFDATEYGEERRASKRRSTKKILASQYNVPVTTITGWVRTARQFGFLEPTSEGKRGGSATQLARDVVGELPAARSVGRPQLTVKLVPSA